MTPFKSLKGTVQTDPADFLEHLAGEIKNKGSEGLPFHQTWKKALDIAERRAAEYEPAYSEMAVVKCFEEQIEDVDYDYQVQYGNSSAIRLANIFAGTSCVVQPGREWDRWILVNGCRHVTYL
jgi:2-succinyl-5-enolpyruvyl-6-hydroxy-3-cyclohexene-1-carboxylate synthase